MSTRLLTTACLAFALGLVGPAQACWDGIDASGDRVSLDVYDGAARWSPALAQRYADGIRRIEALLPPDASVSVRFDRVTLCLASGCRLLPRPWRDGQLDTLFDRVADALEVEPKLRRSAAGIEAEVWTVEVVRTDDRRRARAMVERLLADGRADPGFLEASVRAEETDATYMHVRGSVHSVRVGAFLDRDAATTAAKDLGQALGRRLRVRRL